MSPDDVLRWVLTTSGDPSAEPDAYDTTPIAKDPYVFSITHNHPAKVFAEWLEAVIDAGLDEWQARL